jgi:hypothetical protein
MSRKIPSKGRKLKQQQKCDKLIKKTNCCEVEQFDQVFRRNYYIIVPVVIFHALSKTSHSGP